MDAYSSPSKLPKNGLHNPFPRSLLRSRQMNGLAETVFLPFISLRYGREDAAPGIALAIFGFGLPHIEA